MNRNFTAISQRFIVILCLSGAACTLDSEQPLDPEIGKRDSPLNVLSTTLWPTGDIPVCWENPTSGNATEREWVRSRIQATWEEAAAIEFTGWGTCSANTQGIHIRINDEWPHTEGLGTNLDGMTSGMVLNFTFNNWGTSCRTQIRDCIEDIAVHEFGHALGFAHEQNRPDTPSTCLEAPQGPDGDETYGNWDSDSVMNYCNPTWNNDGYLSNTDINGARYYYPGNVHVHQVTASGKLGAYVDLFQWSNGWTNAQVFTAGGNSYSFLLKEGDGTVHVQRMKGDGSVGGRVATYDWSSGWTNARLFTIGTGTYLFLLKEGDGTAHVRKMNSDGSVGPMIAAYDWSSGWDTVEIFKIGSQNYLFLLKSGTGDAHIHRLNSTGTVGTQVYDARWSSGWTSAEFFTIGGSTYMFLLKDGDGTVHIDRVNANGTIGSRVANYVWSQGWTSAEIYQAGTKTHLIILKAGTGDVHIHDMNSNATIGSQIFASKWRPGWTSVTPYTIGGQPYMFLLQKTFTGAPHR